MANSLSPTDGAVQFDSGADTYRVKIVANEDGRQRMVLEKASSVFRKGLEILYYSIPLIVGVATALALISLVLVAIVFPKTAVPVVGMGNGRKL